MIIEHVEKFSLKSTQLIMRYKLFAFVAPSSGLLV